MLIQLTGLLTVKFGIELSPAFTRVSIHQWTRVPSCLMILYKTRYPAARRHANDELTDQTVHWPAPCISMILVNMEDPEDVLTGALSRSTACSRYVSEKVNRLGL